MIISNHSKHGMMLVGGDVPKKGEFIEIQQGNAIIVGQVRWSCGDRCGVRTQEAIAAAPTVGGQSGLVVLREAAVRSTVQVRAVDPSQIAEQSRWISRFLDEAFIVFLGAATAVVLGSMVLHVLSVPFGEVSSVLSRGDAIEHGNK